MTRISELESAGCAGVSELRRLFVVLDFNVLSEIFFSRVAFLALVALKAFDVSGLSREAPLMHFRQQVSLVVVQL